MYLPERGFRQGYSYHYSDDRAGNLLPDIQGFTAFGVVLLELARAIYPTGSAR